MRFERLAHFVTGVRCEPTPRGIATRVILGLVCTAFAAALMLVFLGAAAGNANALSGFGIVPLLCAAVYVVYFAATVSVWRAGQAQAAQYMAWLPWLLLAAVGLASFVWGLGH